jgi:hypothetical protein
MTRSFIARRGFFAALLAGTSMLLASCGGGGSDDDNSGTAQWRVLNLNPELASIDVYTGTDKRFTAVATDTKSGYSDVGSGSYTVKVTTSGSTTALLANTYSLSKDKHYTAIVSGRGSAVRLVTLPEDEDNGAISAGTTRVRMYNANVDAGSFDVYLTVNTPLDQLGNLTPLNGTTPVAANTLGGFKELAPNTYQLRVTGGGKPNDVRLDTTLTLPDKVHSTLIITAGTGGALVDAALLVQQGDLTVANNTMARVRVAAGVETSGVVNATIPGVTTPIALASPSYNSYQLVPAGNPVTVTINGQNTATAALAAGADYTVLAYGTLAAPTVKLITDDNHLPATGSARVRLYNGASTAGPLKLNIGLLELVNNVGVGTVQSTTIGVISTASTVTVSSGFQALFSQEDIVLPYGVYSVFLLGGASTPQGTIFQDR